MIKKWDTFINESSKDGLLHYTIDETELKGRGYTFQKLYAANYKTYRKKIEDYTIWLWVRNKAIEIDDWFDYTGDIIKFVQEHYEEWSVENNKLPKPRSVMQIQIRKQEDAKNLGNPNSYIQFKDYKKYYKALITIPIGDKDDDDWTEYKKYAEEMKQYRNITIHYESFLSVIDEINYLTK